ncbi:S-layer homology domain-containing protein [Candidatus Peregrinibacteria bacterium]|nr:MAG: S-layer homology domain-containing protein [Candidatus Peregrinibacteria bacterium]
MKRIFQKGVFVFFASCFVGGSALASFSDISPNTPFASEIETLQNRNVLQGYADGTYRPEGLINRYDFVKIIIAARFSSSNISLCETSRFFFPDVPASHWAVSFLCLAKEMGVIKGYSDGTFHGEQNITLAEALKVIFFSLAIPVDSAPSSDPWYTSLFEKAEENNLLTQLSNAFPNRFINRGEMAHLFITTESTFKDEQPEPSSLWEGWKKTMTTVFWVGELPGDDNAYISNTESAWDDKWMQHFGGTDDPNNRCGYRPCDFIPKENPFYFALPYNDLDDNGNRKKSAELVPWFEEAKQKKSILKNRWIAVSLEGKICYAQWQDVGPLSEDDFEYVFGDTENPKNSFGASAGLDISPATWDCLGMTTNAEVHWKFVSREDVPEGPWTETETTTDVRW